MCRRRICSHTGLPGLTLPGDGKMADSQGGAGRNELFVKEMGRQSVVLLKNEGGLLPLDKTYLRKILVTGPMAEETGYMMSRYGPNGLHCTSMLEGIRNYLEGSPVVVDYSKGCEVKDSRWPRSERLQERHLPH